MSDVDEPRPDEALEAALREHYRAEAASAGFAPIDAGQAVNRGGRASGWAWLAGQAGLAEAEVASFVAKQNDSVPTADAIAKVLSVELPMVEVADFRRRGYLPEALLNAMYRGNLAISFVAGVASTLVLLVLGVPYAVALGLLVAILDLVPLAGATIAAVIVATVGFLHSVTAGVVLIVFFIVYQQFENHVLQPLVYGRTVQLSPLVVLIAVLMGAKLAGVVGALGAIPIAGSIQVVLLDWLAHRRRTLVEPGSSSGTPGLPP